MTRMVFLGADNDKQQLRYNKIRSQGHLLMKRKLLPMIVACSMLTLAACTGDRQSGPVDRDFISMDLTVLSRGVAVPATIVAPVTRPGEKAPLVVMAHGHGGSRDEAGGFRRVAEALAGTGVASIRIDFPGCGDSTEPFTENNLTNMLLDLEAARVFAGAQPDIDDARVGILGYSMGGRLAVMLAQRDPDYQVMVTWAPSVADGNRREVASLGGPEAYRALKQRAQETGVAEYTTRWGTSLQLGPRWFTDVEESSPLRSLSEYRGALLVLYGDQDDVVPPATAEAAIAAATSSREVVSHVVPGAEHGLGFYTNRPEIAAEVVDATVAFLAQRL
jgi:dienelactone hydrolase